MPPHPETPSPGARPTRRWLVAWCGLLALAGCASTEPEVPGEQGRVGANVPVYKVVDSNGSYLQPGLTSLLGHRDLTVAVNAQPGQGLLEGPLADSEGTLATRITQDVDDLDPNVVVIQVGTVDTSSSAAYERYPDALDSLLASEVMRGRLTAWFTVSRRAAVAPYTVEGADRVNAALHASATRHPNLWVVDLDRIWSEVFGDRCPVFDVSTLTWDLGPMEACYEDLGVDPHYDRLNGQTVQGLIEHVVIVAGVTGQGWGDHEHLARQLREITGVG